MDDYIKLRASRGKCLVKISQAQTHMNISVTGTEDICLSQSLPADVAKERCMRRDDCPIKIGSIIDALTANMVVEMAVQNYRLQLGEQIWVWRLIAWILQFFRKAVAD